MKQKVLKIRLDYNMAVDTGGTWENPPSHYNILATQGKIDIIYLHIIEGWHEFVFVKLPCYRSLILLLSPFLF